MEGKHSTNLAQQAAGAQVDIQATAATDQLVQLLTPVSAAAALAEQ